MIEARERQNPVFLVNTQPKGWNRARTEKVKKLFVPIHQETFLHAQERAKIEQSWRWERKTGVKPEDTHLAIIMPIHDEEHALSAAMSTLFLADVPRTAHIDVIFLTNACKDKSGEIVDQRLYQQGECMKDELVGEFTDPLLDKNYLYVKSENTRFLHINTNTPGKANALNIGNKLALQEQHPIVISVDANNYLEPDAIRNLYARTIHLFSQPDNPFPVVTGDAKQAIKPSLLSPFLGQLRTLSMKKDADVAVNGWLFAWDPKWIEKIGGIPKVVIEDYALGLLAKLDHKAVDHATEAISWGYRPNTLRDTIRTRIRQGKGRHQMLSLYPDVEPFLKEDIYLWPFRKRIKEHFNRVIKRPYRLPLQITSFILWEYIYKQIKIAYKKDPLSHTWEDIYSTKNR